MRVLYDTRTVHPLDRFEHYRGGAACELAPVEVHGRAPGRLFATMSTGRIGDFELEELTWTADAAIVTRRTERLIRVSDPEQYRLLLPISGEILLDHAGERTRSGCGDVGLYDLSLPWEAVHLPKTGQLQVAMLTFPRALLPVDERAVQSIIGVKMRPPERGLMVQIFSGLAGAAEPDDYAGVLADCTVGLIRRQLGLPHESTSGTRRLVNLIKVREVIRANLHEPRLGPDGIAKGALMSPRYLHKLFQDTGVKPMELVKRMRMDEARRRLANPARRGVPIRQIAEDCGYVRPDRFARDFRQAFGVTPSDVRNGRTDKES